MLFSQVTAPTSKLISDAQGLDAGIKMALLLSLGVKQAKCVIFSRENVENMLKLMHL